MACGPPAILQGMARILAIHAHPDDVEILAGGTMALLASLGHEITIATMTPGDCGSHQYGPEEIAAIRRREAANAAKLIGASYVCVEFRDLAIFNDDSSRRRVTEVLRKTQPELVLTSAPAENYKTGDPAPAPRLERIPHLYFMDPVEGRDRNGAAVLPECIVDVSGVFPRKREMLAAHASQRNWLREHHGIDDYLNLMEQWTVARGQLAGLSHGEGFRLYATHPYPTSRLLEQLLGARAIPLAAATGV